MSHHFGWTMVGQIIQGISTYMTWKKSKFQGVRYREHKTRKHGRIPDRYYTIFFKLDGKMHQEALGWASESWEEVDAKGNKKTFRWTETRAKEVLAELKKNQRLGTGPRTLKEKRSLQEKETAKQKAESITLNEFWEKDYLPSLLARVSKSSWEKEVAHFKLRISPCLGDRAIKSINSEDLEKIINHMRAEELTPRTQEYALGTFNRIWKYAAKRKIVKAAENPASDVHIKKINNTRTRVLSPKDLSAILHYLSVSDPSAHDITIFCAFTGCRFSEAANLKWENIDFAHRTAFFSKTKNGDSREIPLEPCLVGLIENRGPGHTGGYVFTKKDGSQYKEPPSAFKTAADNLGLNKNRDLRDKVTMHTLRHTAATYAARNNTSVKDMQDIFGWKTASMVLEYTKSDENTRRNAMRSISKSLSYTNKK